MKPFALLLCVISFFYFGCSSTESTRKGKLSDAVEASSDDHQGERKVDAAYREPNEEENEDIPPETNKEPEASENGDSLYTTKSEQKYFTTTKAESYDSLAVNELQNEAGEKFSIGLFAGTGLLSSSDFYGLTSGGLNLVLPIEGFLSELYLSGSYSPIQETSKLSRSLDEGVSLLEIGVQVRFPTTPEFTFIGHYFFFGFGGSMMLWSYKNPFLAPTYDANGNRTGDETIFSDGLNGINLFVGTGIDLTQTLPFHFIAEITPGIILWNNSTHEGFDNNIFSPFVYFQFRLKCNIGSL